MVSFRDAYLVTSATKAEPLGVVRRDGAVWRVFVFGEAKQPKDVFETRRAAGTWLLNRAG